MILKAHVEEVLVEGGRASGVRLKSGKVIRATKAVVSGDLSLDFWISEGSVKGKSEEIYRTWKHIRIIF